MANDNKVSAELREKFGKGAARKLRVLGKIPAVIYGHGTDPVHVALPAHAMTLLLRKANQVLEIDLDGTTHLGLVKDVQKDPVRQIIEHIDLIVIRKGEKVEVEVPVHLTGDVFPGNNVDVETKTLRLLVEATHIPENVVIDVSGLDDGAQVHAKDVTLPAGAVLADSSDLLMVNVYAPRGEAEDEAPAAE
ncbi:50S ribosomal protein L25/general stress protein Ctc [Glaciibacter psychrotolerans]|uniref:Large ribosomal subunit protein bL25 n=1 Tax=Glaciibacter psychrotolerans TaxID=670054 RepID=A0A7Z0J5V1_9MICO|nr:50S ribosomal protein L25/general stress protein Ctc [Leifsonia psychrotolerans]NYJ19867.1 large subunit ribosomal protein L25 [Leifsonia psychrotolerans]